MTKRPKVSICVPIYNMEKYLSECLDSLVNQTLKDIEIVCVNDESKDKSLDILNEYSKKYSNIKVISQKNTGLGGARNTGLKNASGEYVGFVDADDFVEKDMYQKLYDAAIKEKAEISMCNLKFYPPDVKTKKTIWFKEYKGIVDGEFLNKNTQPWNKIVSKDLIKRTNFEFYEKNGDGMFVLLMIQANGIVSINDKLYNYRVGHSSMSTNYKLDNFIISINSAHKQIEELSKTNLVGQYKEYFEYRLIYSLIQGLAIAAKKCNKEVFNKYKKELKELKYKKNIYTKKLLKKEFSFVKYYGMVYILPLNYQISKILINTII